MKLDTKDFEIELVRRRSDDGMPNWNKKTRVYVNLGTLDPRYNVDWNGESAEDVYKRVTRQYAAYSKANGKNAVEQLIASCVVTAFSQDFKIRFSWKAGCSCGCSCGNILDQRLTLEGTPIDVYVTVKAGKSK